MAQPSVSSVRSTFIRPTGSPVGSCAMNTSHCGAGGGSGEGAGAGRRAIGGGSLASGHDGEEGAGRDYKGGNRKGRADFAMNLARQVLGLIAAAALVACDRTPREPPPDILRQQRQSMEKA